MSALCTLQQQLASGDVSSVELTKHYLDTIHRSSHNAFINVCDEQALAAAHAADQRRSAGDRSPLLGIPCAHKDIFCTQGVTTSCASLMLADYKPPYTATIVQRLADAGCVMLGKTNMDEFAMGSSNEHSAFGPCLNPWDTTRVPGGSSGGSAVAVAAGLAPFATGTDTGGSIRQPAAFCGITGLKPSYGLVSRYGMIAFASSLDQAGPMTQSAEDAALVLNVMAGHDPKDSTSHQASTPDYTAMLNQDLRGKICGLPMEYYQTLTDPCTIKRLEACQKQLADLGVNFVELSLAHTQQAIAAYYVIAPAECSSNMARYDGIRYGFRAQAPHNLDDLYNRSRTESIGDEVKRRILIGTYVLSSGYYDAYYQKAQKIRHLILQDFKSAFQSVDFILAPTTPTPAFSLGEKTQDPLALYASDIYTVTVNLAGLPSLAFPIGFNQEGLPIGAQLIGPHFSEAQLLNAVHQYQCQTDWHCHTAPEEAK